MIIFAMVAIAILYEGMSRGFTPIETGTVRIPSPIPDYFRTELQSDSTRL